MDLDSGGDFEDSWSEIYMASSDFDDAWTERVPLGAGGVEDFVDTWHEVAGPPLVGEDFDDTWTETTELVDVMDWWRELPDLTPAYSEDVQRPVGRVEEE